MRVIHITVRTKETQKLCIMFVLYCSTCQTQTKTTIPSVNRSTNLATGRHLHPWIKDMRTAVQKISNFCLPVANPSKDEERSPTSHLSVHGFCPRSFVLLSPTHIKDEAGEKSDIASQAFDGANGRKRRSMNNSKTVLWAWSQYPSGQAELSP